MEPTQFDRFTKALTAASGTRRAALGALAGGMALLARATGDPHRVIAKGKHKKKKKKRCIGLYHKCDPNAGRACCTGENLCCPPQFSYGIQQDGGYGCADKGSVCCTVSEGGGWCDGDEKCCKVTQRYPGVNDYCESIEGECCNDAVGGSCGPGLTCCVNPQASPKYTCCPKATGLSSAVERATHAPRNFRLRGGASPR